MAVTDVPTMSAEAGEPEPESDHEAVPTRRRREIEAWCDTGIVTLACLFVFGHMHPELLLANTTPNGGDMGAHVWGPAYVRDHLLPHGRLTGWTPDWYAGFPAFHYYMIVPTLAIIALDVVLPYGVAFKLITVAGLVSLPLCAYVAARLADAPFPVPAAASLATLPFLFNTSFSIYGGNILSTMAGEFAFSISLSFAVLYIGVLLRGLRTGKHRAWAAVLLAMTGLCHLIPAFFALAATVVIAGMHLRRATLRWLLPTMPVAGLLSAFWVLPFFWRRAYMNDMGWDKETKYLANLRLPAGLKVLADDPVGGLFEVLTHPSRLVPGAVRDSAGTIITPAQHLDLVLLAAVVGVIVSFVVRNRLGMAFTWLAVVVGLAFRFLPQARLWNARLLPFWHLCLYVLAGVALAELVRAVAVLLSPDVRRPKAWLQWAGALGLAFVTLVGVARPLRGAPATWIPNLPMPTDKAYIDGWSRWNYTGYERKPYYPEFYDVVTTMEKVGAKHGCGRAMWEYEKELDRFGTPMALMLLPHFTDGCIGSMEGLYFEASSTTPWHFLNQSELSAGPSQAQRDLPYSAFDIDAGIAHLQLLGVKYYMALSPKAKEAAATHPDLERVAKTNAWVIYEVKGSELVTGLEHLPNVLPGPKADTQANWLGEVEPGGTQTRVDGPATQWYMDRERWDVFLASGGPANWPRVPEKGGLVAKPTRPVKVSDIVVGDDRISFDVDRIGVPTLVKASYFPNWKVSGAKGPWRVAPNLMVVVPTATHVSLHYGWTPIDLIAWLLTFVGIVGVFVLWRARPVPVPVVDRRRAVGAALASGAGTAGPIDDESEALEGWLPDLDPVGDDPPPADLDDAMPQPVVPPAPAFDSDIPPLPPAPPGRPHDATAPVASDGRPDEPEPVWGTGAVAADEPAPRREVEPLDEPLTRAVDSPAVDSPAVDSSDRLPDDSPAADEPDDTAPPPPT